jgi:hypothetical protein
MTQVAEMRMKVLFKLGFNFNGSSFVHDKGSEIATYELDYLDEEQFLKTIYFILEN